MLKRSSSLSGHWCEMVIGQSGEHCGKDIHANWICPKNFMCIILQGFQ